MKNYREFIHVSVFSGTNQVVAIDADKIKFDDDGYVWLYRNDVELARFPSGVWEHASIIGKWIGECSNETVFHMNYWIAF